MVGFVEASGDINDPTDDYVELVVEDDAYSFYLRHQNTPIESGSFYRYRDDGVDLAVGGVGIAMPAFSVGGVSWLSFHKSMYELGEVVANVNYRNATFNGPIIKYNTYNGYQLTVGPVSDVCAIYINYKGEMVGDPSTDVSAGRKVYVNYGPSVRFYTGYGNYFEPYAVQSVDLYDIV